MSRLARCPCGEEFPVPDYSQCVGSGYAPVTLTLVEYCSRCLAARSTGIAKEE